MDLFLATRGKETRLLLQYSDSGTL